MNISDLFTIFRVIIGSPELIRYSSENEISGAVRDFFFRIEVCCGGSGAVLTLSDSSKVNFDLNDETKEIFDTLFAAAKESVKKI